MSYEFGSDRFNRFHVYWMYKQTERQRKVQIDLEYSNIQTNMGEENGGYMRNEDGRYGKIENMEEWRV